MSNPIKRIYHIADIHIRNVKRHKEYRAVFNKLFREIQKRGTKDSIIFLGGDIAHAKLEMSPELVHQITWFFKKCAKLCPTILIAGNHDCNMNNSNRLDVLTPIVEALDLENFYYLRDTQIFKMGDIGFGVYSIFDDKENWPKADDPEFDDVKTKIALFHGPVDNSQTDIGYVVSSRHFTTSIFDGYDLALLGDIHKRQELISPGGCKVVYCGSTIQQNFGETLNGHGMLVWDVDSRTYESVDISNDYGYYTLDVTSNEVPDVTDMPKHARLRVRISNIDTTDTKSVITQIKVKYGINDFTVIRLDPLSKLKTGNRNNKLDFDDVSDINYQNSLLTDYISRMMPFISDSDLDKLKELNTELNEKVKQNDDIQKYVLWKPIKFEFSNMFSYGEDNVINFNKVGGIAGLFAPNATGKSSIFDAVSFCLYDKCSRAFKASNILNNRKKTFSCHLEFQIDGVSYHILREAKTVNKGKNVKVNVNFWKIENGESISLNGTERRDTNAIIEQYVGTYDDFVLTALSVQGNNAIFHDKSQSERKDLLAKFMGLDIFDKLYEIASDDVKEVNTLIKNFKKIDFTSELAGKIKELKSKKSVLAEKVKEMDSCTQERDDVIKEIMNLTSKIVKIDDKLDINELEARKKQLITSKSNIISDKETKKAKLEEYSTLITEISQSIEENKFVNGKPIEDVKVEWDNYTDEISQIEHSIDLLEQSIKHNKKKLAHLEKHEYDPNCKFCMNNVFVKDALATKEIVENEQKELDDLYIKRKTITQGAAHISDIADKWDDLQLLKNKYQKAVVIKEKAEVELREISTRDNLISNQIESVELNIKKYFDNEDLIKQNLDLKNKISINESIKLSLDDSIKHFNNQINGINSEIGSITTFIDNIKAKMDEVKSLEEKHRLYSYYIDTVKRDGISYELISKALPVIETEINNILAQVVEFGVVLDVDGKNINGRLVYDDQEWPLEMCSGMERFISGLAIRIALINICNLPRPNFVVIDEGFGSLDAENLASLFMMMQYLKTQFDFIWVISHLEQMRDIADQLIEIKKTKGFSNINF